MTSLSQQSPGNTLVLDTRTVQSVVEHMNSDHAAACLSIVKAFSGYGNAVQAQLIDMNCEGLLFRIQTHSGHEAIIDQNIRIDFDKPLRTEIQIRGALIGLTRQARQKLADK